MKLLKLRFELNSQCQAGYRKRRSLAGACVIVQREVFPACGNTAHEERADKPYENAIE